MPQLLQVQVSLYKSLRSSNSSDTKRTQKTMADATERAEHDRIFKKFDANGDGKISELNSKKLSINLAQWLTMTWIVWWLKLILMVMETYRIKNSPISQVPIVELWRMLPKFSKIVLIIVFCLRMSNTFPIWDFWFKALSKKFVTLTPFCKWIYFISYKFNLIIAMWGEWPFLCFAKMFLQSFFNLTQSRSTSSESKIRISA